MQPTASALPDNPGMREAPLLHVLGGGPWQVPTVQTAKAMGLRVLVTDMFAQRPAYALADLHEQVDITDPQATLAVARRHGIHAVICDTTDIGVCTAAFVADQMGLPGIGLQAAQRATNKSLMRQAMAAAGVPSPAFRVARHLPEARAAVAEMGLPLILKPVDNQSGRGVVIVHNADELAQAWELAHAHSRSRTVILEALAAGHEYIVDGFAIQGKAQVLAIAAKTPYDDNPTISARILYLGGAEFDLAHQKLAPATQRVIAAMGLRNGVFHAEFKLDGTQVVPLDVAARGGGVHIYSTVLPHVSGIDAIATTVGLCLGQTPALDAHFIASPKRLGACIEFFRTPAGTVQAIEGIEQAQRIAGVAVVQVNVEAGQMVGQLLQKDDRPGYIVTLADDHETAIEIATRAKACLGVRMAGQPTAQPVH